jgi:hypothetical protein
MEVTVEIGETAVESKYSLGRKAKLSLFAPSFSPTFFPVTSILSFMLFITRLAYSTSIGHGPARE